MRFVDTLLGFKQNRFLQYSCIFSCLPVYSDFELKLLIKNNWWLLWFIQLHTCLFHSFLIDTIISVEVVINRECEIWIPKLHLKMWRRISLYQTVQLANLSRLRDHWIGNHWVINQRLRRNSLTSRRPTANLFKASHRMTIIVGP